MIDEENTDAKPEVASKEEPSLEGLVKMHKGDKTIHAHPSTVEHHQKKGWKTA